MKNKNAKQNMKFSKIQKHIPVIIIACAVVITGAILFFSSDDVDKVKVSRDALVSEFTGAYVEDIEPNGNIVEMNMTASESEVEIFDGYKTKVWSYNDTVPGPEVRVKLGDTLRLNFTNDLPQETTIHFHGVRVPNAMDGVPGVTQDPIKPGESFVYEFTPKDAGTFWFHPHVRTSEQVERGLFGTLIVEDDVDQKYSQDIVWVIDDWRMTEDRQVYEEFNTPMDLMHDGRWGNVMTVNGKLNEVLDVKPGERIRLRMVNASNARIYMPSFKNLNAKIIAVDGMYVKEVFDFGELELSPGNRIDIDITIPQDADGQVFELVDNFGREEIKLARIEVAGQAVVTPEFNFPVNSEVPDWTGASDIEIDKEYRLNARRKTGEGMGMMGGIEWTINDKAYPDYDPYTFKYAEFNTMRFTNESVRLHPMHLHGQFFKVIARDGVPVSEPYFRDTVLVYPNQSVDVALVPLDKGLWVNHCHILEHAAAGMLTAVEVK